MKEGFLATTSRIFLNSLILGTIFVLTTLIVKGFGKIQPLYYFFIVLISFALTIIMITNCIKFIQKKC